MPQTLVKTYKLENADADRKVSVFFEEFDKQYLRGLKKGKKINHVFGTTFEVVDLVPYAKGFHNVNLAHTKLFL